MDRRIVLIAMCVGLFLVQLDVTIVNVALPTLRTQMHADVSDLQWTVNGYAIALAALLLAGGTLGDRHGHKRVVMTGLAVFGAGSLICGVAGDVGVLVVGRVVQGVGAALLLPGTLAVISRAFPEPGERARAIGTWAAVSGLSLPAGLLVGGALVGSLGWRSIFLINLPIVVAALIVTARVVRESRSPGGRLDITGTLGLFRSGGFSGANAIAGAMNLGSLGNVFVLTLYLQGVRGYSPLEAGLAATPAFSMLSIVAPFGGRLAPRLGNRACVVAGLVISAAGLASIALASASYLTLLPGFLLWGGGLGILTPAVVAAAMGAVPDDRAGLASGVNNTARQAGGAIGIAAFGAIAGSPSSSGFVHKFHVTLLIAAALYCAAAALAVVTLKNEERETSNSQA